MERQGHALGASQRLDIQEPERIASPELFLLTGPLPHLECSREECLGGYRNEGEHGDTR